MARGQGNCRIFRGLYRIRPVVWPPWNPVLQPATEIACRSRLSQIWRKDRPDMATIRPRGKRWQAQIRRCGHPIFSRTFTLKRDAEAWARATEAQLERGQRPCPQPCDMREPSLAELVIRYRDGVSCLKKGRAVEWIRLCAFLRHPLCQKPATHI